MAEIQPHLNFCVRCRKHPCQCTAQQKKVAPSDISRKEYVQRR